MRVRFLLLSVLLVLAACGQPSRPSDKPKTPPEFVAPLAGRWTGTSGVVVEWAKQKQLPVVLDIAPDGSVTGSVGDANLVNARLAKGRGAVQRSLGWARDFRVHGKLEGDLIATEGVRRDGVDIVFDRADDGTLVGGLTSSGSKVGGKDEMQLAAGKMVLRREAGDQ